MLNKIDEIIDYLKRSDEYIKYCDISDKMKHNVEIMNIVNKVKDLQKKIVKEEFLGNKIDKLEEEINMNLELLNGYPIYQEFTYIQEDLNNTFQDIKNVIEKYINDKTN